MHPEFKHIVEPFEIFNDVAVIRTISRIQFGLTVQPIPLGVEPVPATSQVVATGWGLTGDVS
jgi:Trypsin